MPCVQLLKLSDVCLLIMVVFFFVKDITVIVVFLGKLCHIIMPRCTMHRRHTVVRSCVGSSVTRSVRFCISL